MLIALGSIKGSPGVTTLAVALAAQWPGGATRRLLVECDPAGGDLAMRFDLPLSPGLVSLAVAHRDTPPVAAARVSARPTGQSSNGRAAQGAVPGPGREVWEHVQSLPGGLPVLLAPPGYERARAALTALTDPVGGGVLVATGRSDRELLIADCGRLDPGSATWPIAAAADRLLVLARPRADELAHLASRLDVVAEQAGRTRHGGVDVVLVGDGYPPGEVAAELGAPVLAVVPDDPAGAAALGGQPALRRAARRGIAHAAAQIATLLAPTSATSADTVAGPVTAAAARVDLARS